MQHWWHQNAPAALARTEALGFDPEEKLAAVILQPHGETCCRFAFFVVIKPEAKSSLDLKKNKMGLTKLLLVFLVFLKTEPLFAHGEWGVLYIHSTTHDMYRHMASFVYCSTSVTFPQCNVNYYKKPSVKSGVGVFIAGKHGESRS